ncbi:unnamed protein product [Paramecium primaurelia]|uniref:Uncharacterized protein n=1 Tax=Paramecium primaurelia TaxID=5886 RepID=A0A8S1KMI5_PARPR|nr:unnamed protein product [Paramecium primaurelia]
MYVKDIEVNHKIIYVKDKPDINIFQYMMQQMNLLNQLYNKVHYKLIAQSKQVDHLPFLQHQQLKEYIQFTNRFQKNNREKLKELYLQQRNFNIIFKKHNKKLQEKEQSFALILNFHSNQNNI